MSTFTLEFGCEDVPESQAHGRSHEVWREKGDLAGSSCAVSEGKLCGLGVPWLLKAPPSGGPSQKVALESGHHSLSDSDTPVFARILGNVDLTLTQDSSDDRSEKYFLSARLGQPAESEIIRVFTVIWRRMALEESESPPVHHDNEPLLYGSAAGGPTERKRCSARRR